MKSSHIAITISLVSAIALVSFLVIGHDTTGHSAPRPSPGINLAPTFSDPVAQGVWSDGSTMWVVDDGDRALVAYDVATGDHLPNRKIALARNNVGPRGVWSDGNVIWVADRDADQIFAYDLHAGERQPHHDFSLDSDNDDPDGLAGRNDTLFVVDHDDTYVYAYSKIDGARQRDSEFDLRDPNEHPWGIWADEANVWISDFKDGMLYGYSSLSHARLPSADLRLPVDNSDARGIWADGNTMWVVDNRDHHIYSLQYRNFRSVGDEVDITSVHTPRGLWTDGETMWVVDAGHSPHRQLSAYRVADGAPDPGRDIRLDLPNHAPVAIWSDGTCVWVADADDNSLYVYGLGVNGLRYLNKEFSLSPANTDPGGIWSDGETMWVSDSGDDRLYAYDLSARARREDREFDLALGNSDAAGIWSDGQTLWVMDASDRLAYAYDLHTGGRRINSEFRTVPDNDHISSLTGHGHRFWVSDTHDNLLYAYGKANAPPAFSEYAVRFDVHHNLTGGRSIGTVPPATDPDGDPLTYSAHGADAGLFDFNPQTNLISFAGDTADFAAGKRFYLTLSVSDGKNAMYRPDASLDDTINVSIDVVPNAPPKFNIPDGATLIVRQDAAAGQVVAVADATDPDGDPLTYSVVGQPNPPLHYDEGNFTLLPNVPLDASSPQSYQLTLLVRDNLDKNGDLQYTWDDQVEVTVRVVKDDQSETVAFNQAVPASGTQKP